MSEEPKATAEGQLTYGNYLKVPELLSLQVPQSEPAHHDEMLFIVIHQAYELWFKLILHELENTIKFIDADQVLRAQHFANRTYEILRVLVGQIHILETMQPYEFLKFRSELMPASGFQSAQFRELEFILGLKDERYLSFFDHEPAVKAQLKARIEARDVRKAFHDMLRRGGFDVGVTPSHAEWESDETIRQPLLDALRPIYENRDEHLSLYLLAESLLDLDEYLSLWRFHHVRVVERIIGFKRGTGGSTGVSYLLKTVDKQVFPCLWAVRTNLEVAT